MTDGTVMWTATWASPRARMRVPVVALVWSLAVLGLVACGEGPTLRPVPEPPALDAMDPVVREQYRDLRGAVDDWLAGSGRESDGKQAGAEAMGRLGMWFQAYGLADAAREAYGNARTLDPEEPTWAYYEGLLYKQAGEFDAARTGFLSALEGSRSEEEASSSTVRLAEVELELGLPLDEISARLEPLEGTPAESPRALLQLARVRRAQGQADAALELARRSLTLQPSATQTLMLLGQLLRDAGRTEEAKAFLVQAQNEDFQPLRMKDPWSRDLWAMEIGVVGRVREGRALASAGQHRQALLRFRRALEMDPENESAAFGVAWMQFELGRVEESAASVERLLAKGPESDKLLTLAGRIAAHQGEAEAAERHFRRAVELNPSLLPAWRRLAALLEAEGRLEDAAAALESALELAPTDSTLVRDLAELWAETGRRGDAIKLLQTTLPTADEPWSQELLIQKLQGSDS